MSLDIPFIWYLIIQPVPMTWNVMLQKILDIKLYNLITVYISHCLQIRVVEKRNYYKMLQNKMLGSEYFKY